MHRENVLGLLQSLPATFSCSSPVLYAVHISPLATTVDHVLSFVHGVDYYASTKGLSPVHRAACRSLLESQGERDNISAQLTVRNVCVSPHCCSTSTKLDLCKCSTSAALSWQPPAFPSVGAHYNYRLFFLFFSIALHSSRPHLVLYRTAGTELTHYRQPATSLVRVFCPTAAAIRLCIFFLHHHILHISAVNESFSHRIFIFFCKPWLMQ